MLAVEYGGVVCKDCYIMPPQVAVTFARAASKLEISNAFQVWINRYLFRVSSMNLSSQLDHILPPLASIPVCIHDLQR